MAAATKAAEESMKSGKDSSASAESNDDLQSEVIPATNLSQERLLQIAEANSRAVAAKAAAASSSASPSVTADGGKDVADKSAAADVAPSPAATDGGDKAMADAALRQPDAPVESAAPVETAAPAKPTVPVETATYVGSPAASTMGTSSVDMPTDIPETPTAPSPFTDASMTQTPSGVDSPAALTGYEASTQPVAVPASPAEGASAPSDTDTGAVIDSIDTPVNEASETPAIAMIGTEVGTNDEDIDSYFYDPGSSVGEVDGDAESNAAYDNYRSGYFTRTHGDEDDVPSRKGSKTGAHGAHDAHGTHRSKKHHRGKKGGIIALVIVLVLAALCAGYYVWEKQPSFCGAFCHTPMSSYYQSYTSGDTTYGVTACKNGGANCLSCHTLSLNAQFGMLKHEINGNYDFDSTTSKLVGGTSTASVGTCLLSGCHADPNTGAALTTIDDLKTATSSLAYNPHDFSQHGSQDCSSCHKMHAQSVYTCTSCHEGATADLPEGWAAASIDTTALQSTSATTAGAAGFATSSVTTSAAISATGSSSAPAAGSATTSTTGSGVVSATTSAEVTQ